MKEYYTDRFLDTLYEKTLYQTPRVTDASAEDLPHLLAEKRTLLRDVIGLSALDALQTTPPAWQTVEVRAFDGYIREESTTEPLPGLMTPIYILTPPHYTRTIIYCHGHGHGAVEAVDAQYMSDYQFCLPITLARAGFRVIVPELMGFNRVVLESYDREYERGCYANSTRLLLSGVTMTAVRVRQIEEIIDAVNREGAARPIIAGISGGGLVAAYTAALRRDIAGAFISCYANTFKASIMSLYHCIDNFIPNILSIGEEPDVIALACPTPLLLSAGDEDDIFPIAAAREVVKTVQDVYTRYGAGQNVTIEIFHGGHRISTEMLLPWLSGLEVTSSDSDMLIH